MNENIQVKDYIKNVFGTIWWKPIQTPLFAWIISGENILLQGETGSNKTGFVENFARVLNLKFRLYTAPKTSLEDIAPFTKSNDWKIIPQNTLTSIWDANLVFLDELNRVSPQEQGMFFEILRWKSIKWIPLSELKWVFSAANPEDYAGTHLFDAATANRFSFIIEIPNVWSFEKEDIKLVWKIKNTFDNKAVTFFNPNYKNNATIDSISDETKKEFITLLTDMADFYITIYNHEFLIWNIFIDFLVSIVQKLRNIKEEQYLNQNYLEGRKINIFKKNLLSWFSSWYHLYYKDNNKILLNLSEFKQEFLNLISWSNTQKILWNTEFWKLLHTLSQESFQEFLDNHLFTNVLIDWTNIVEIIKVNLNFSDNIIDQDEIKKEIMKISNKIRFTYSEIQILNFIPILMSGDIKLRNIIKQIYNNLYHEMASYENWKYKDIFSNILQSSNSLDHLIWLNYYYFIRELEGEDNKEKNIYYSKISEYNKFILYFKLKRTYIKKAMIDYTVKDLSN